MKKDIKYRFNISFMTKIEIPNTPLNREVFGSEGNQHKKTARALISEIYDVEKQEKKFVMRLSNNDYIKEREEMTSEDEFITIKYTYAIKSTKKKLSIVLNFFFIIFFFTIIFIY